MRSAGCGVEDPEVIVDFRGGGQGGATGATGVALFNGEGRGKTLNRVDCRGGKAFEMKAGVSGEAFEVAALSFGVDRVESEGGFSGARRAGEDDQAIFRDVEIEPSEVVLPCAANTEDVAGSAHGRRGKNRAGPG